jgi:hypothetical protein
MKKIILIVAMFAMYLATSEMSAKKKAVDFCDSIKIGDGTSHLREDGIATGARANDSNWSESGNSTRQLDMTYTGFYPGSDFICRIRETNGFVVSKNPNVIRSLVN